MGHEPVSSPCLQLQDSPIISAFVEGARSIALQLRAAAQLGLPTMHKSILALCAFTAMHTAQAAEQPWQKLLDKDLSLWDVYLSYPGDVIASVVAGTAPASLQPVGLNKDSKRVFSMMEDHGIPVLRISGEIYGSAAKKHKFSNYQFMPEIQTAATGIAAVRSALASRPDVLTRVDRCQQQSLSSSISTDTFFTQTFFTFPPPERSRQSSSF